MGVTVDAVTVEILKARTQHRNTTASFELGVTLANRVVLSTATVTTYLSQGRIYKF